MTALGASVLILGFGWGVKLQPAKFNNYKAIIMPNTPDAYLF
jgi:hypothetical protein